MSQQVIVRGPDEGRTVLVGGSDFITYRVTSAESGGACFIFQVSATPGFGPPLHRHSYHETFHVLEGEYEFTFERDGELVREVGAAGTTVSIPPDVAHTFKNVSHPGARMLNVHVPAALEEFFEEFGVPVERVGEVPDGIAPPDFAAMGAALERNGVRVLQQA